MENPCKIIFFGDSIIKGTTGIFLEKFVRDYPEINLSVINAGVVGETSSDGLERLQPLVDEKPDVVVIGFGMNDWRKEVSRKEYKKNLVRMLDSFEAVETRVIINTVIPSYDFEQRKYNCEVDDYSEAVREISYENRIKIADMNALWKRELAKPQKGLRDHIHPNNIGYEIICKSLMYVVPRRNTTVLWQYNGHEAKCNYRCPYCYYLGLHNATDKFFGKIEQWHDNFKESFGNQHLMFYLAFGEPTFGNNFLEILDMVNDEPNWELRLTSNVSYNLEEIVKSRAAREGRVNINASFHPCMIKREDVLKRILYLRENGIEVPIVYVVYPPYLKHFESDVQFFRENQFVVHVRRFVGKYKNNTYPFAYTEKEFQRIAKYADDGTIEYMLNQKNNYNWLTYSGFHFFVVDNVGNVGYDVDAFQPYTKDRSSLGNINTGNFRPCLEPTPYPGVREGTVDGVANLVCAGYKELEHNNVLSFARQGGVYKTDDGKIIYVNEFKDFTDPKIRAEYLFSPRNLKDVFAYSGTWKRKMFNVLLSDKKLMRSVGKVIIPKKSRGLVKAKLIGRA